MKRLNTGIAFILIFLFPFLAPSGFSASSHHRVAQFSGEVEQGQTFTKEIRGNLIFQLIPYDLGWTISLADKTNPAHNFTQVVTPPYHGTNDTVIEGWHFRNADNTGPNDPGPKNVNVPQKVRAFNFVLNEQGYDKAVDTLNKMLYPSSYSSDEIEKAGHVKLITGTGTLTINKIILNHLKLNEQAGIDSMTFDVRLEWP
jgi:hypothetical protein